MTYTEFLEKKRKADDVAQLAQANADAWRTILREYPDVLDGESNFNVTREFCDGNITMEKFRVLYQERPTGYGLALAQRIHGEVVDDRPRLIAAIMETVDPNGVRHSETLQSKYARAARLPFGAVNIGEKDRRIEQVRMTLLNYEAGLKYKSRAELMDELERKGAEAELRSKSPEEIRQRFEASRGPRPEPPRADGKPRLPTHVVPKGHVSAMEATPANLKNLAKVDYPAFRDLCDRYGSNQITERMR